MGITNELKNYKYDSHKDSVDDHAADALRYFMIHGRTKPVKSRLSAFLVILLWLIGLAFLAVIYLFQADILNLSHLW